MHQEVISAVGQLCSNTVAQYEAGFKAQVESDKAVIKEVENARRKARAAEQAARLAAEEAAKLATEHAMADLPPYSKKEAVSGPQDVGYKDDGDDNDNRSEEEEDGNDSAADEVRIP
jgi:multidrug efflux pump subunit AcrA (membrane-fusion protein)